MKTEKRKMPPPDATLDANQRKLEEMGLGSDKQRQHYRNLGNWPNYGHIPQQKADGTSTLQWFRTDKDDSAIHTTAAHKHA